jgi:uncharacterized protein (TIGR03118 family)
VTIDGADPGNGFVDVFDFNGNLIQPLVSNGKLNSPWGLALAPAQFGDFSNALLVGNFGDGTINAYDPNIGTYLGTLQDATGTVISIPGLWALRFGNGVSAGDVNTLYFTAGIPGSGKSKITAFSVPSRWLLTPRNLRLHPLHHTSLSTSTAFVSRLSRWIFPQAVR